MLDILNVLPVNLVMRMLIIASGVSTIVFFIMTMGEMIHTFWSFAYPKKDWYKLPKIYQKHHQITLDDLNVSQPHFYLINLKNGLVRDFWIGIILIALLIVIFPLFHI